MNKLFVLNDMRTYRLKAKIGVKCTEVNKPGIPWYKGETQIIINAGVSEQRGKTQGCTKSEPGYQTSLQK